MQLFKKKTKNIELKQDISQYLVFPYSLKGNVVWLNKSASVPENTMLLFASRGKILDVFQSGEYMLGAVTLPKCAKKFKLYKLDKTGAEPKYFDGFVYFLNLNEVQNLMVSTYKTLNYKNEVDGKFKVKKIDFCLNVKIKDYETLMKNLFNEFAYLRMGEAENIITNWLSEFVTDTLQKIPHRKFDFEGGNLNKTMELLTVKVSNFLEKSGLEVTKFSVVNINLGKIKTLSNLNESQELEDNEAIENDLNTFSQNQESNLEENLSTNPQNNQKTEEKASTWNGWENFINKK